MSLVGGPRERGRREKITEGGRKEAEGRR